MTVELPAQIACVKRELAMRRSAYPRWIQAGKMKQAKADEEIAAMEAVLRTLQGLLQPGLALVLLLALAGCSVEPSPWDAPPPEPLPLKILSGAACVAALGFGIASLDPAILANGDMCQEI